MTWDDMVKWARKKGLLTSSYAVSDPKDGNIISRGRVFGGDPKHEGRHSTIHLFDRRVRHNPRLAQDLLDRLYAPGAYRVSKTGDVFLFGSKTRMRTNQSCYFLPETLEDVWVTDETHKWVTNETRNRRQSRIREFDEGAEDN